MPIVGTTDEVREVVLYDASGREYELVGNAEPVVYTYEGEEVETDRKTYEERVSVGKAHGLINGEEELVELVFEEVDDTKSEEQIKEKEMTEDEKILAEVARLQAELAALKNGGASTTVEVKKESNVKKNQKPGKADPNRKYVRLGEFKTWGSVPQQQLDLAKILAESMDLGAEWTEEEVFELVKDSAKEHESLRKSKQDPTYLFRYYRGLKNDGKHAGFIARGFLRMS